MSGQGPAFPFLANINDVEVISGHDCLQAFTGDIDSTDDHHQLTVFNGTLKGLDFTVRHRDSDDRQRDRGPTPSAAEQLLGRRRLDEEGMKTGLLGR